MSSAKQVAVLGCGSWGTALADHLNKSGHQVVVWGIEEDVLEEISSTHKNSKYFPNDSLSEGITTTLDLKTALDGAEAVVLSVPSSAMRAVAKECGKLIASDAIVVSTAKGLEDGSLKTMSEVLQEELGANQQVAALSGPSFAAEVIRGMPTAVTIAAKDSAMAERAAEVFHHGYLRIYTSTDLVGVQLGGVVKNIIAVAAGMLDGVGMGTNTRAALITRGLVEMQSLITSVGGEAHTVTGLSGLGDLLLTATGDLSRNRRVGTRLGQGEPLEKVLKELGQVAEGVKATRMAMELAARSNLPVPIIEHVHKVIEGQLSVNEAVDSLLSRERKSE